MTLFEARFFARICFQTPILILLLISCSNPSSVIKKDKDHFKQQNPDNIKIINWKGRKISYAWSGDPRKRALVFVHGSPGNWDNWTHFLSNRSLQQKFHLIAVDRFGYGRSDSGKTEESLAMQAEVIYQTLKTNKSSMPAFLLGHSYGGAVIAKAAAQKPDLFAGLVFIASSIDPALEETKWLQYPASWWPIRHLIPTSLRVCNEEILALKKELEILLPQWKKIKSNIIVIHGETDKLVPVENVKFLNKMISRKLILKEFIIPNLNHFIPWRRPDLILDAISILNSK